MYEKSFWKIGIRKPDDNLTIFWCLSSFEQLTGLESPWGGGFLRLTVKILAFLRLTIIINTLLSPENFLRLTPYVTKG